MGVILMAICAAAGASALPHAVREGVAAGTRKKELQA